MNDQVKRLLIVVVVGLALFFVIRRMLIPESFGEKGHYRAKAEILNADQPIVYAGHEACRDCHNEIEAVKSTSYHRNVKCEACHGPGQEHIASDAEFLPVVPRDRKSCEKCHAYDIAKPTGFPQIDPVAHNPVKPCITCHNPHTPDPPSTPGECSACHAGISRTKALSPHAGLDCRTCHVTDPLHFTNPRLALPTKPSGRDLCARCHSRDAQADKFIPRIDPVSHGGHALCWECHYPHYPEAN